MHLIDHPANDIDPTWSPDGRHIAFGSDRDGDNEIYRIRADGTDLRRLTENPANDCSPTWSEGTLLKTSINPSSWGRVKAP